MAVVLASHSNQTHTQDVGPKSSHLQCSSQNISDMTSDDDHQHLHKEEMKATDR